MQLLGANIPQMCSRDTEIEVFGNWQFFASPSTYLEIEINNYLIVKIERCVYTKSNVVITNFAR